ncbi:MAG: amidohydrolase family protein [Candidatus Heimdallarchaeota archaeon]|nr:amidohydrolase family protein [Candidatus Heimdallarchaeota archaeon]
MPLKKERLILRSGNVFDSLSGKIKKNTTIVISERKIVSVLDDSSYEKEKGDKILDVTGKTILPGLIETHVHLDATGEAQTERETLRTKTFMWHYIALSNAQKHLMSGFTCVRDCGSAPDWAPALRRIFDQGVLAGPRLSVSDRFVGQFGNSEMVSPDYFIDYYRKTYEVPTGVDGIKHTIRERKMLGADFIKTATTGGVLHGIESKLEKSFWMDEEIEAMVEEAHRLDMHVACHAHGREGIYRAVKFGIDTIEHGSFVDEETATLMVKNGTYLIPTQAALINLMNSDILEQMPPEVQRKTKETANVQREAHQMAFKKGVKFAIGTDAGTPGNFHGKTGYEIKFMVDFVGMTPVQAMQAATIEGARAIWMDDKIGSIEIGKFADIIVSAKNPIEDISVITNPMNFTHIIRDGKIMVEKGKITYFPT